MADATPAFPRIVLSDAEREYYDQNADTFLRQAVAEYGNYPGYLDQGAWTHVRRAKDMSVYKSAYGVRDPQVTLMLGVGCIPGTVDDVMSGIYCDTTESLRTVRTLLKHPLVDAGVLNVSARASEDEPFRFAGIKWFSAKVAYGMAQTRDVLAYERMGRTRDALGHELAYHVLYSIDRPEWPADGIKGIKRQHQITCFLYRQLDDKRVECFLWGTIYRLGSVSQRLAEYAVAGVLLAVVHAPESARARKLSKLMESSDRSVLTRAVGHLSCYTCRGQSFLSGNVPCAGCSQFVCRSCSSKEKVFSLDLRTQRVQKRRFCLSCVNGTAGPKHQATDKSADSKLRRKKKTKGKSMDATLNATPVLGAVPVNRRQKSEVASDFSSARHWTSDSSESTVQTTRSTSAYKYSDVSDSDSSEDEDEVLPRGLTAADLVALSHDPVRPSKRSDRKRVSFNPRENIRTGSSLSRHNQHLDEPFAMLEAHHEIDPADVDTYHQSPDSVEDTYNLNAMSGLSQFSLGMDIHGNNPNDMSGLSQFSLGMDIHGNNPNEMSGMSQFSIGPDIRDSSRFMESTGGFAPNRTLVMPSSLRSKRGQAVPTVSESATDNRSTFLGDLYAQFAPQGRQGPRRGQQQRR